MEELDILILGAGWTATFLIPLLTERKATFAATTTTGRSVDGHPTLKFKFDPDDPNIKANIAALPRARYIIITFPLVGTGPSKLLTETYETTHLRLPETRAPFTRLTPSQRPARWRTLPPRERSSSSASERREGDVRGEWRSFHADFGGPSLRERDEFGESCQTPVLPSWMKRNVVRRVNGALVSGSRRWVVS